MILFYLYLRRKSLPACTTLYIVTTLWNFIKPTSTFFFFRLLFRKLLLATSASYKVTYILSSNSLALNVHRTVSSKSSLLSAFTANGHQPLTLFCLKRFIWGTVPSVFSMSRLHCLADLAPLGNRVKSRVSEPTRQIYDTQT